MSNPTLQGKVALVTGATSGIGRAAAVALAQAGARVVVNHRPNDDSLARAAETIAQIEAAGGSAVALAADVAREDEVQAMFARTAERYGGLDILVNNAGIEKPSPIQDMSLQDWQAVIDVNLTGQFLCAREAVRLFLARAPAGHAASPAAAAPAKASTAGAAAAAPASVATHGGALGNIIFISSVHEVIPWAFQANYAASKGGVSLLMRSLAQELAPMKIRVNSVAPGAIRTPINRPAWETGQAMQSLLTLIPYGRIGEPDDVGRAVVWLASDDSDYVVGATLFIDGGMTLYPEFRGAG